MRNSATIICILIAIIVLSIVAIPGLKRHSIGPGHQISMTQQENERASMPAGDKARKDTRPTDALRFTGSGTSSNPAQAFYDNLPARYYAALANPNISAEDLYRVVFAIGRFGHIDDARAVDALYEFIQRPVAWDKWSNDEKQVTAYDMAKCLALDSLGRIGGAKAERILREAMTPAGARELTKAWLNENFPKSEFSVAQVLEHVQGTAAGGLAFLGIRQENRDLIVSEYDREKQTLIHAGQRDSVYFGHLCDAMARMDMIHDIGREAYDKIYETLEKISNERNKIDENNVTILNTYSEYLAKYGIF
jgi:hypothetical protein